MGKKKKKGKKRRAAKRIQSPPQSFGALLEETRSMARQGRGRRAAGLAKLLVKHPEFTSVHLSTVAQAHELRMREMLKAGQIRDAALMYDAIAGEHPDWASAFCPKLRIGLDLQGVGNTRLIEYESNQGITKAIDEYIKADLFDLLPLAQHPELAPEHPLKRAAATILAAWEQVECENDGRHHYETMVKAIRRHSPFLGWRLFIQALAAYYERDDQKVVQCLERLEPYTGVQKMARVLRDLISGTRSASAAGQAIERRTSGTSLFHELRKLEDVFDEANPASLIPGIRRVLTLPDLFETLGLCAEIGALCMQNISESPDPCYLGSGFAKLLRALPQGDRIFLLGLVKAGEDDVKMWNDCLHSSQLDLSSLEKALVFDRMAELTVKEAEEDEFSIHSILYDDPERDEILAEADHLWEESVSFHPLPETYRRWYETRKRNGSKLEKILEQWHKHFPEDVTPLFLLVDSCRARNVFQKAMSFFNQLDRIARGMPEVEAIRHYLILDNAVRKIAKGKKHTACELLESIEDTTDSYVDAIRTMLRWYAQRSDGKKTASNEETLIRLNQPLSIACIEDLLPEKGIRQDLKLPPLIRAQMKDPDMMVANLHLLTHIHDPQWNPKDTVFQRYELTHAFNRTSADTSVLRDCLTYLLDLRQESEIRYHPESLWALTATGIARKDRHLAIFLAHRAVLLDWATARIPWITPIQGSMLYPRILDCMTCAHQLATKEDSLGDLRLVDLIADHLDLHEHKEERSPKRIEAVVELEKSTTSSLDLYIRPKKGFGLRPRTRQKQKKRRTQVRPTEQAKAEESPKKSDKPDAKQYPIAEQLELF